MRSQGDSCDRRNVHIAVVGVFSGGDDTGTFFLAWRWHVSTMHRMTRWRIVG